MFSIITDDFYQKNITFDFEIPTNSLEDEDIFFTSKTVSVGGFPWYEFVEFIYLNLGKYIFNMKNLNQVLIMLLIWVFIFVVPKQLIVNGCVKRMPNFFLIFQNYSLHLKKYLLNYRLKLNFSRLI